MPRYDYRCIECGVIEELWRRMTDLEMAHRCIRCGGDMIRLISAPNIRCDIEPYVDENMGHEPVHVESRQHKKQLLKERGLTEIG